VGIVEGPGIGGGGGGGFDFGSFIGGASVDIISKVGSGLLTNYLTSVLINAGVPPGIAGSISGGAAGAFGQAAGALQSIASQLPSTAGGGIFPNLGDLLSSVRQAAQPFDPGGLGGGFFTAGPYLGAAGAIAGDLLRSKRVKLSRLLTSVPPGAQNIVANLFDRGTLYGLVGGS